MEAIQSWGICIVVCVLAAAVVQLLFPNMEKEKSVRVLISVFLLSAVLSPFLSGSGLKLDLPELDQASVAEQLEEINRRVDRSIEEQARARLEAAAAEILSEYQITVADITVETDILDDGHIQIDEIIISSSEAANWDEISDRVAESTGCPVRINTEVNEW